MIPVLKPDTNYETEDEVYFFNTPFSVFDNFSAHAVELWGLTFPTAEHAYQWKKFADTQPQIAAEIFKAPSPHLAQAIANENKDKLPALWQSQKVEAMSAILTAKAAQHEDVKKALKNTEQKTLIENSPVDNFWGLGPDGQGKNTIGHIWMNVRHTL